MNRDTLRPLLGGLVGVVAVAVAAATLTGSFTVGTGESDSGFGGGSPPPLTDAESVDTTLFEYVLLGLFALGVLATLGYGLYLLLGDESLRDLLPSAGALVMLVLSAVALFLLFRALDSGFGDDSENASAGFGGDAAGIGFGDEQASGVVELPAIAQVGVVVLLLGVVALVAYRATGDVDLAERTTAPPPAPDTVTAEVGRAAGRAADRIEAADADVDNEVYRAWKEMTEVVAVERPRSSTPAEFADAAVEAGIDREHVAELTRLFEEVRYGGKPAAEREEQAVAALRGVEAAYAAAEEGADEP